MQQRPTAPTHAHTLFAPWEPPPDGSDRDLGARSPATPEGGQSFISSAVHMEGQGEVYYKKDRTQERYMQ